MLYDWMREKTDMYRCYTSVNKIYIHIYTIPGKSRKRRWEIKQETGIFQSFLKGEKVGTFFAVYMLQRGILYFLNLLYRVARVILSISAAARLFPWQASSASRIALCSRELVLVFSEGTAGAGGLTP